MAEREIVEFPGEPGEEPWRFYRDEFEEKIAGPARRWIAEYGPDPELWPPGEPDTRESLLAWARRQRAASR